MTVRIRMKKMGRTHRPYFRICAMDQRTPRDGRVLEELGTYDPLVADTDARAVLKADRIDYWLGVGAQPSDKVSVLIKKYGSQGTHKAKQNEALQRLSQPRAIPDPGPPASLPKSKEEPATEASAEPEAAAAVEEAVQESAPAAAAETAAEASEPPAAEGAAAEEAADGQAANSE